MSFGKPGFEMRADLWAFFNLQNREERLEVEPAVAGNHTPTLKSVYGQYFGY